MITNSFLVSNFTSYNWIRKPWILILLFYIIPDTQCEPHSVRYYYTGMSRSEELKEFQAMTYVDDQQIISCHRKKIRCHPVASWMKDTEDDNYWKKESASFRGWQEAFYENLLLLKHWFNNTNGLLVLQLQYGCDILDNGYTIVHYRYGFEGRDYSLFDTFKTAWDPVMVAAQFTDDSKNPKKDVMELVKSYLAPICSEDLKKYIGYGRDNLEWKVQPEVRIVPVKVTDRVIRLQCLAYGFHPRPVDVKWVRNGVDQVPSDQMNTILPHSDGTYQIRVSMEMPNREGDTYSCHVDHSSLKEEITKLWDPQKNNFVSWITKSGIPLLSLLCVAAIILLILCLQKRSGVSSPFTRDSNAPGGEDLPAQKLKPLSVVGDTFSEPSLTYFLKTKKLSSDNHNC